MQYRVTYAAHALRDLESFDRYIAQRIVRTVKRYAATEQPLLFAKRLTGPLAEKWRFRVGDYRVIFRVEKDCVVTVLLVLRIKHRREAYQ